MDRLISADKLREAWLEDGENEYVYDTNDFLCSIDAQPTVDAAPVVHGRWIPADENHAFCPNCNKVVGHYERGGVLKYYKYCPRCGAKMDLEE